MTFRILRPETAFASPRLQRSPRRKDSAHLDFIRNLPCLICFKRGCHAAHIRYPDPSFFKRETGIAEKPDDKFAVPLCPAHHTDGDQAQHRHNERDWWRSHDIDPLAIASQLFVWTGDEETAEQIIRQARRP